MSVFQMSLICLASTVVTGCYYSGSIDRETQSETVVSSSVSTESSVFRAGEIAYEVRSAPLSLQTQLNPLLAEMKALRGQENRLVCAQTFEIQGLFLCIGSTEAAHHAPLMRAAIFAEGRPALGVQRAGQVVSFEVAKKGWGPSGGHDLPRPLLEGYFSTLKNACAGNIACMGLYEFEFARSVMAELMRLAPSGYSVITFDVESESSFSNVKNHEISHGQFFQQAAYRQAVINFWNSIPPNIREAARIDLAYAYDVNIQELLINEFHAYVLDGTYVRRGTPESIAGAKKYDQNMGAALEILAFNAPALRESLVAMIRSSGVPLWAGRL